MASSSGVKRIPSRALRFWVNADLPDARLAVLVPVFALVIVGLLIWSGVSAHLHHETTPSASASPSATAAAPQTTPVTPATTGTGVTPTTILPNQHGTTVSVPVAAYQAVIDQEQVAPTSVVVAAADPNSVTFVLSEPSTGGVVVQQLLVATKTSSGWTVRSG